MSSDLTTPEGSIEYWSKAEACEMANSQTFIKSLGRMLGVPLQENTHAGRNSFKFPVKVPGTETTNWIDLYQHGHFVWKSKQFSAVREELSELELTAIKAGVLETKRKSGPVRETGAWDDAMVRASGQAERYIRQLPASEPNPAFPIVCDVSHSLEIYADFSQNGRTYLPFPDPRSFRIKLKELLGRAPAMPRTVHFDQTVESGGNGHSRVNYIPWGILGTVSRDKVKFKPRIWN